MVLNYCLVFVGGEEDLLNIPASENHETNVWDITPIHTNPLKLLSVRALSASKAQVSRSPPHGDLGITHTDTPRLFAGWQHLFCTCPCAAHRNAAQKPQRLWIYGDIQNAKILFKDTAFLKVHSCFEAAQPQYCKKQKRKVRQLLPLNKNFRQCELLTFNSLQC